MDEPGTTDEWRQELDELRASRARVVAAADDERRRIERALHDGVQQHLVALAVNLQLARELGDSDPAAARRLLDEIAADVREALDELRALAHSVYPALLRDRGPAEALRAAAAEAPVAVRIEAPAVERYPPGIEAAVYFSCLHALELVGAEGRAVVRLEPGDAVLRFEVALEGSGRHDTAEAALSSLRDRLGAVNGTLGVVPDPDGIRIAGEIPLPR
jgi:signal transduction histidine kinase